MDLTPFFFGLAKFVKYGLYPLTWLVLLLSAATVLPPPPLAGAPDVAEATRPLRPPPPSTALHSIGRECADRLPRILASPATAHTLRPL